MAVDKISNLNVSDLEEKKSMNEVKKPYRKLVELLLIAFSICTLLVDIATDLVLVFEYSSRQYFLWAGLTLLLVVLPTLVVEAFSIRWHSLDGPVDTVTWVAHALCLGVAHRYLLALRTAATGPPEALLHQQQDLCLLHLFNSFLEAAPQLVLQLYVTARLGNIPPWTGLSLLASLLSLAWAISGYTRAMRLCRPDKQPASWAALGLQAAWRTGTLSARVTALTVLALASPSWLALMLGLHWVAMTAWAVWQRTDFCETWWEERAYNAVVGVVYCFCFFNLREGPSRLRATAFYLIAALENAACVAAYALWGGEGGEGANPGNIKLVVMAVTLATLLGLSSMLVYYAFFHPAGVILPCVSLDDCERHNLSGSSLGGLSLGGRHLRTLRHERQGEASRPASSAANSTSTSAESPSSTKLPPASPCSLEVPASPSCQRRPLCDMSLPQDQESAPSSPAREESPKTVEQMKRTPVYNAEETEEQLKRLPVFNTEKTEEQLKRKPVYNAKETEEQLKRTPVYNAEKTEEQLKRQPVYNIDLSDIEELPKIEEDAVTVSEDKTDVTSTCMSTHDYENICAVNIAREPWGLRHWEGYSSDIAEHDSSVGGRRDCRRDTVVSTSTSCYSSSSSSSGDKLATAPSDYLDSLADELRLADYAYVGEGLDTIPELEEYEETSSEGSTVILPKPGNLATSCSSLVATIEEIRRSASLCNLYQPDAGCDEWPLQDNNTSDVNWQNISNKPLSQTEIDFLAQLKTCDEKFSPPKKLRRKFSLLRERFEIGSPKGEKNSVEKTPPGRSEVASVTSRIQQWNNLLRGRGSAPRPVETSTPSNPQSGVTLSPVAS